MVADKVTIDTLSWQKDAKPVHWECDGDSEYSISEEHAQSAVRRSPYILMRKAWNLPMSIRPERSLRNIAPSCLWKFISQKRATNRNTKRLMRQTLSRKIQLLNILLSPLNRRTGKEDGTKETVEITPERKRAKIIRRPQLLNDVHPLWTKHPNDCTEDEYKEFYRKVFMDYKEPLFWIHLNMDYPFNLKGILYFRKSTTNMSPSKERLSLYNNQVFIADNIKEVIPEFLMLLKGVIDCPDLPLNVSRSALQNDGFVRKISDYITKKVADRLSGMFKTDRGNYEKYWDDINPFIKFGCIKDQKFNEKMKDFIIYKNLEGKYITLDDYLEAAKEKHENQVFYVTDEVQQSQYINMFKG